VDHRTAGVDPVGQVPQQRRLPDPGQPAELDRNARFEGDQDLRQLVGPVVDRVRRAGRSRTGSGRAVTAGTADTTLTTLPRIRSTRIW
jgi:hypothetical protein